MIWMMKVIVGVEDNFVEMSFVYVLHLVLKYARKSFTFDFIRYK
jgi:hypothetical protein